MGGSGGGGGGIMPKGTRSNSELSTQMLTNRLSINQDNSSMWKNKNNDRYSKSTKTALLLSDFSNVDQFI